MIHLQIRAKSGLHAGAMWRLDQTFVSLGANPKADVFLCDPDIPENLITLRKMGRRYEIESVSQNVKLTSPDHKKVDDTLFPSQLLTLDFNHIQLELQVVNAAYGFATSMKDSVARNVYRIVQFLRGIGARAIVAFLFVISLLMTTLILFFGTAGVGKLQASVMAKTALDAPKPPSLADRMARNVGEQFNEFAQRISAKNLVVDVKDNQVSVSAELSRPQAMEFEQLLARAARDNGEMIDIKASLQLSAQQQQIDQMQVEQIVLGSKPAVVLRDGERLYVGGTYQGVILTSIQSDKVIFQGDTLYEIAL